ncbi:hypothetical protein QYE76_031596 [Lolium multiflorum]|uniref:Reverse transcriptase Ty1/copia-type domain-containing protein n=1 Tax=Lolium multiflorum TaxID=4521 RepID=A0AAD8VKK7_LOLMU|nr:hypothetical protein QYE76_031596 [Lolium multiflorum]
MVHQQPRRDFNFVGHGNFSCSESKQSIAPLIVTAAGPGDAPDIIAAAAAQGLTVASATEQAANLGLTLRAVLGLDEAPMKDVVFTYVRNGPLVEPAQEEDLPRQMTGGEGGLPCICIRWLYGSIASDIADMVMAAGTTSFAVLTAITDLFRDNQQARPGYLGQKFSNITQEDKSVTDYCLEQKAAANALADVIAPVTDNALVWNTIKGLHGHYKDVGNLAPLLTPFPSFLQFRNMLLLQELKPNAKIVIERRSSTPPLPPAALAALHHHRRSPMLGAPASAPTRPIAPLGRYRGNKKQPAAPVFPSAQHPWRGAIHMYPMLGHGSSVYHQAGPGPNAGLLGSQPRLPLHPAHGFMAMPVPSPTTYTYTSYPNYGAPAQPTWDPSALASYFNTMSLQAPSEWVMHTGASAHMSSDAGISTGFPRDALAGLLGLHTGLLGWPTPAYSAPSSPSPGSPTASSGRGPAPAVPTSSSSSSSSSTSSSTSTRPPSPAPAAPIRQMVTRRQAGKIIGPRERLDLNTTTIATPSPFPKSVPGALKDPNWLAAMSDEYGALLANDTLDRYKARWVLSGFSQEHDIDFDETFSQVVKPATIRVILSVALSSNWKIRRLDVKNAFLHGHLDEVVFCHQPTRFVNSSCPDHVCRLNRALYGLKQAPRAWYHRFATFITTFGFTCSKSDTPLFIMHGTFGTAYLLLYVDDIILTASSSTLLERVMTAICSEFTMTDLGDLHHFLGLAV